MAEQLMNGLSRAEATAEANRLRQAGHSTQDINNKLLGYGRWKNNKGKMSDFKAYDNGGGKMVFKEAAQIQSTKNKVENRRISNKVISTPDKSKRVAADKLSKKINGKGLEADHKHKLNKTANALKGLSKAEQAKFLQGYEKVGNPLGHQPSNIQALDRASHQEKTNNEKALERNLKKMSKESKLSRIFRMRVRVNKYNTISEVLKNNVPSPTVDMGIDMDELAPHKRFHSVPGGLVPPISYI
tara:strand:+ start:159 stop:887 length:729 start_codon:yes stop_codon:yes gene_type:complete